VDFSKPDVGRLWTRLSHEKQDLVDVIAFHG
jgi:hypothetical protein